MAAEKNVSVIECIFARDFALSCLAEAYASIGDTRTAQNSLNYFEGQIKDSVFLAHVGQPAIRSANIATSRN